MATHAQIARSLTANLPPGVFAHAARAAVIDNDYALLERMYPGMKFAHSTIAKDRWALIGTCEDGSILNWQVGG